jgi:PAS domain S-box-containing protein/putative nucleotidyltransferase with HDIG domain
MRAESRTPDDVIQNALSLLSAMIESTADGILVIDQTGQISRYNQRFLKLWRIPKPLAASLDSRQLMEHVLNRLKDPDSFLEKARGICEKPETQGCEAIEFKDGRIFEQDLQQQCVDGEIVAGIWSFRDVTGLRRAETAIRESEERFRQLFENIHDVACAVDRELRILAVSPSVERVLGYRPEEMSGKRIQDLGIFPPDQWQRVLSDVRRVFAGERLDSIEYEFLARDGKVKVGEVSTSPIFQDGKVVSFISLARDVTDRRHAEEALRQSEEKFHRAHQRAESALTEGYEHLRKALEATIQAMAATVETRDPYTAGHQRRVADLAHAIAQEMGLSAEEIEGVRLAAVIHDIGKISIPAEILSKPIALTEIEYQLIKTHSQTGYDILKDIDFPWPVARIVVEHHERMDGSGYPAGLKGEAISLLSRILAVADVVEAIASHRPHRPARNIEAALDEIGKYSGILYDPRVVEACSRLFRGKDYHMVD